MSIFRETFKVFLQRQLKVRQAIVDYNNNDDNLRRPLEFNQYTSGKACWSRMTSLVNYDSPIDSKGNRKYTGAALSKKYVLQGGTLYSKSNKNSDKIESYALRGGLATKGAAYGSELGNKMYGYRPMPGISSINVKSRTAYGSLRDATVTFYCWDKKQLDELEILFMRPGYGVFLEWGWSMYLDSSKSDDVKDIIGKGLKSFDDATLNPFQSEINQETIYEELEKYKEKYCGNYDGMFGIVRNFSWEMLPNGGFQCTTNLISTGEVIDSIKVNSTTGTVNIIDGSREDKNVVKNKTEFELFLDSFPFQPKSATVYPVSSIQDGMVRLDSPKTQHFIQFGYFIYMLNKKVNLFDHGKSYYEIEVPLDSFGSMGNGYCLASEDSVSVNPNICIIKNSKATFSCDTSYGYNFNHPGGSITAGYMQEYITNGFGVIGEIYLNLEYAKTIYLGMLADKNNAGDVSLKKYILDLLKGMSSALGNINDFDIFAIDNKVAIIDKNYCDPNSKSDSKFLLNILGTNSVIRKASISSKIFASQANMIAVAAGVGNNIGSVHASTQTKLNEGMTNRFFQFPAENADELKQKAKAANLTPLQYQQKLDEEERIKEELKAKDLLVAAISNLRSYMKNYVLAGSKIEEENANNAASVLKDLILKVNYDTNFKAIIPINLELTMDGIGGFIIGQVFRINADVLPEAYSSKHVGFIISELGHDLVRNDWTTTIKGLVVLLDQDTLVSQVEKDALTKWKAEIGNAVGVYEDKKISDAKLQITYFNICAAMLYDGWYNYKKISISPIKDVSKLYSIDLYKNSNNFILKSLEISINEGINTNDKEIFMEYANAINITLNRSEKYKKGIDIYKKYINNNTYIGSLPTQERYYVQNVIKIVEGGDLNSLIDVDIYASNIVKNTKYYTLLNSELKSRIDDIIYNTVSRNHGPNNIYETSIYILKKDSINDFGIIDYTKKYYLLEPDNTFNFGSTRTTSDGKVIFTPSKIK